MLKVRGSRALTKAESPLDFKQREGKTHAQLMSGMGAHGLTTQAPCFTYAGGLTPTPLSLSGPSECLPCWPALAPN